MYEEWGITVDKVINPPLDCSFFRPSTTSPKADYVLTAFGTYGKEGDFSTVKTIADAGVAIKVFGDYSEAPNSVRKHPHIDLLGKVSDLELRDLYSNALYTLFAFGHEPFGYIPVESMACGTPVLTYNMQGPSETVINEKTGWLANSKHELLAAALGRWQGGYDAEFRRVCRERALTLDVKRVCKEWYSCLNQGYCSHSV
jgi:glycosyltransferase involved in cell wall biosynthesis